MFKPYLIKNVTYPLDGLIVGESVSVARQLSSKHKKAFTAFRSNDSAELDIGFRNGELDTNTLMNFIGSNSGYVKNLYGVNGSIFTADSSSKYPRIVNAGILDRDFDTVKAGVLWPTFDSASLVNFLTNSNFLDKSSWNTIDSGFAWDVANNIATITNLSSSSSRYKIYQNKQFVIGHKYYFKCEMKSNSSMEGLVTYNGGSTSIGAARHSGSNNWETLSFIGVATATNGEIRALDTYRTGDISASPVLVKNVIAIDVTNHGKPAMYFDGTNDALWCSNNANIDITSQPFYLASAINVDSSLAADGYIIAKNLTALTSLQYAQKYNNSIVCMTSYLEGVTDNLVNSSNNSMVKGIQTLQSFKWDNDTMQNYDDGIDSGSSDTYNGTLTSRDYLWIGCRATTSQAQTNFFKGKLSEFHILRGNPKQPSFETKVKKYYSIN